MVATTTTMEEGKEGDWECKGCNNRNYAFRTFCNRCKQSRIFVDQNTLPNSKWLPRIGDWICTGCTNNNYASREKCKKCGQLKGVAAIPAIAMPGILPNTQAVLLPNMGFLGSSIFQQPLSTISNGSASYGVNTADQFSAVPEGWRSGDWLCNCGFHNYSSRTQCKKCEASPPAHGVKRLATDEPVQDSHNKRRNGGCVSATSQYMQSFPGLGVGYPVDQRCGLYSPNPGGSVTAPLSMQGPMQVPQGPTLTGDSARYWRDGDWMCSKCSNHNYASRMECNRCKTQKPVIAQRLSQLVLLKD